MLESVLLNGTKCRLLDWMLTIPELDFQAKKLHATYDYYLLTLFKYFFPER
jgi:hypothetical protein